MKKHHIFSLIVIVVAILAFFVIKKKNQQQIPTSGLQIEWHFKVTDIQTPDVQKTTLKKLKKQKGVSMATIDPITKEFAVVFDPEVTSKPEIDTVIKSNGYLILGKSSPPIMKGDLEVIDYQLKFY